MLPRSERGEGRRVLIYGAGDGGELLLRELQNNRALNMRQSVLLTTIPPSTGKSFMVSRSTAAMAI